MPGDVLLIDLILFLGGVGDDLAELLAELLVFLGSDFLNVEVEVPPFIMSIQMVICCKLLGANLALRSDFPSLLINNLRPLKHFLVIFECFLFGLQALPHFVNIALILLNLLLNPFRPLELVGVPRLYLLGNATGIV